MQYRECRDLVHIPFLRFEHSAGLFTLLAHGGIFYPFSGVFKVFLKIPWEGLAAGVYLVFLVFLVPPSGPQWPEGPEGPERREPLGRPEGLAALVVLA